MAGWLSTTLSVPSYAQQADGTELARPLPLSVFVADHVAITTNDYQGTLDWYREHLDFAVTKTWEVDRFPGSRFAYIESNDFRIEVIATPEFYQDERVVETMGDAIIDRGISHLAFLVADVDAVHDYFREAGETILAPPLSSPESQSRLFFVQDNSGNVLEFLTPFEGYPDGRVGLPRDER